MPPAIHTPPQVLLLPGDLDASVPKPKSNKHTSFLATQMAEILTNDEWLAKQADVEVERNAAEDKKASDKKEKEDAKAARGGLSVAKYAALLRREAKAAAKAAAEAAAAAAPAAAPKAPKAPAVPTAPAAPAAQAGGKAKGAKRPPAAPAGTTFTPRPSKRRRASRNLDEEEGSFGRQVV